MEKFKNKIIMTKQFNYKVLRIDLFYFYYYTLVLFVKIVIIIFK